MIDPDAPLRHRSSGATMGRHNAFPTAWDGMMEAVDKGDAAQFHEEEVLPRQERAELYFEQEERFKDQLKRCSKVYGNLVW